MSDLELLKLMLRHIQIEMEDDAHLRAHRQATIEFMMKDREGRTTPFQADIRVDQVILYAAGVCGMGEEKRTVETSFEVKAGDQLLVYRQGGAHGIRGK